MWKLRIWWKFIGVGKFTLKEVPQLYCYCLVLLKEDESFSAVVILLGDTDGFVNVTKCMGLCFFFFFWGIMWSVLVEAMTVFSASLPHTKMLPWLMCSVEERVLLHVMMKVFSPTASLALLLAFLSSCQHLGELGCKRSLILQSRLCRISWTAHLYFLSNYFFCLSPGLFG